MSIDFVRGIAVVAMIQTHVWEYYIARPDGWALLLLKWVVGPLGGYAAPLFILVAGLSAHFSVVSMHRRSLQDGERSFSKFFIRGGFLFVLSTGINVITGPVLHILPVSIVNWSTIQLIGFCLCLVPLFIHLPVALKVAWLVIPLLLSEWHYLGGLFVPDLLLAGFGPPFPWAVLFFAGLVIGEGYTTAVEKLNPRALAILVMLGCLLVGPGAWILHVFYRPFDVNHAANPSVTTLSVFIGTFLLLTVTCGYLLDWRASRRRHMAVQILARWGQHSLSIYYVQLAGIVASALILKMLTGATIKVDWVWFVPLVALALLLIYLIFDVIWSRFDHVLSLEWFFKRLIVLSNRARQSSQEVARL
ncbi:MAG: DUF1624 domain-containing protein [Anaerolineae bacterium]|nr:DUF1624 domain-containing protein [Anaerolineae bacterium]